SIACQIILPLGISFFVFEFIHYLVEVHKGGKPVRSFWEFALFASFFPTQIAGPIKRYQDFIPQLREQHRLTMKDVDEGIELILFGLGKKVLLADNMAPIVQAAYAHPQLLSAVDLWAAACVFSFQLYFDFSGYTDIARGSARLLGFKVPLNFDLPYMAGSIAEFWRRWHISLSSWLRDYLFVPLGGSRNGAAATCRNLLITMALGGLWHGAAPHYFVWGVYHGVLLIAHRLWSQSLEQVMWFQSLAKTRLYRALAIASTFALVTLGLVIFRAPDMQAASYMVQKMLLLDTAAAGLQPWQLSLPTTNSAPIFLYVPLLLTMLLAGQLLGQKYRTTYGIMPFAGRPKALYLAALAAILLIWSPDVTPAFIYFQF
ncbi:MAG: MBOAT family O-acyltransferase, partial [Terriglobales bacterium]